VNGLRDEAEGDHEGWMPASIRVIYAALEAPLFARSWTLVPAFRLGLAGFSRTL
jgi:hypothetical protein